MWMTALIHVHQATWVCRLKYVNTAPSFKTHSFQKVGPESVPESHQGKGGELPEHVGESAHCQRPVAKPHGHRLHTTVEKMCSPIDIVC